MKLMLQRVDAMAVAKHVGIVYGVFTAAIAVMMAPIFFIAMMMGQASGSSRAASAFSLVFMIFYPIIGLVAGWIFGWVAGVVFNFAAPRIGGLRFEAAEEPTAAPAVA